MGSDAGYDMGFPAYHPGSWDSHWRSDVLAEEELVSNGVSCLAPVYSQ